jgi:hypothetical protein
MEYNCVFLCLTDDISFLWSMKSGNLQACLMGEFLVLTVLVHLCLRRNWLSRYVIVLLFDIDHKKLISSVKHKKTQLYSMHSLSL